jgi:hypothetical protein
MKEFRLAQFFCKRARHEVMGKNGKKKRRKALAAYFQLCQLFGNSV